MPSKSRSYVYIHVYTTPKRVELPVHVSGFDRAVLMKFPSASVPTFPVCVVCVVLCVVCLCMFCVCVCVCRV